MRPGAGKIHHETLAMTFETSLSPSPSSPPSHPTSFPPSPFADQHDWRQGPPRLPFRPHPDGAPTSIVINISDGGSTGRGILIGLLSAFGSAGIAVLVLAIFFFFKYTSRGRILLDRIGRPGEFDDEQAFAHEEAEALETMDELQRTEYLRAKGRLDGRRPLTDLQCLTCEQLSYKQIHPSLSRLIFLSHNSLPFKKKVFLLGNSNRNWRLRIVLLRHGQRLSSLIPSAAFRATYQCRSKTKYTTGRLKFTINPKTA
jgi:hypothetical protein